MNIKLLGFTLILIWLMEYNPNPEIPYRIDRGKEVVPSALKASNLSSAKLQLIESVNYQIYRLTWEDKCQAVKIRMPPNLNNESQIFRAWVILVLYVLTATIIIYIFVYYRGRELKKKLSIIGLVIAVLAAVVQAIPCS